MRRFSWLICVIISGVCWKIIERLQCVVRPPLVFFLNFAKLSLMFLKVRHAISKLFRSSASECQHKFVETKEKKEKKAWKNINFSFNNFLSHLFPFSCQLTKFILVPLLPRRRRCWPLNLSYGSVKNTRHRSWSPNKTHFKRVFEVRTRN